MQFGLISAPLTFQRMMDHVLADTDLAHFYLDDFMVFSTNLEEHLGHGSAVTSGIAKYGLKLKLSK